MRLMGWKLTRRCGFESNSSIESILFGLCFKIARIFNFFVFVMKSYRLLICIADFVNTIMRFFQFISFDMIDLLYFVIFYLYLKCHDLSNMCKSEFNGLVFFTYSKYLELMRYGQYFDMIAHHFCGKLPSRKNFAHWEI